MSRPQVLVNVPPPSYRREPVIKNGIPQIAPQFRLTCDQALQYTPITTSVLRPVDCIPVPEPSRAREYGRVASTLERKQAAGFTSQPVTPAVANEIAVFINQVRDTNYGFSLAPTKRSSPSSRLSESTAAALSPLARSVIGEMHMTYHYPIDEALEPPITTRLPQSKPLITSQPKSQSQSMPVVNIPPLKVTATPQKPATSKIVVQVPAPLPSYKPEDYVTIEGSPKTGKVDLTNEESMQAQTQRQQSAEALQKFVDYLSEIFVAQDLVDAAGGNILSSNSASYFQSFENEAEDGLSLTSRTLDRLRDELRKLISLQRLRDVAVDDIRRLQQICEPAVERGQTISLQHDDTSSEDVQITWKSRLLRANNSVCSAIVAVYTMIGNPQKEDVLSTDIMNWAAKTLNHVLNACIIPVVEARPDSNDDALFVQACANIDTLKTLFQSTRRLLETMTTACIEVRGGDLCVSTVDFCAARMIFVQNATSEKNSTIGTQTYEAFRKAAMASVSRIYARFPRERAAIMDEVLSSLDKLPSKSRSARTFRIGDGTSIQLISALFMQLVQTTTMDVPSDTSKGSRAKTRRRLITDAENERESTSDQMDEDDDQDLPEATDYQSRLFKQVERFYNPAAKSTNDIVSYLVGKASKTTKTGEAPYRGILDLLVEDLINVADNVEWPAADLLLSALVGHMLWLTENEKVASTKNMALECLGTIASAIYDLRAKASKVLDDINKHEDTAHSDTAAAELSRFGRLLQEGRISPMEYLSFKGPYFIVANYLQNRIGKLTLHQQSVKSYFLASIAKYVSLVIQKSDQVPSNTEQIVETVLDLTTEGMPRNASIDYLTSPEVVAGAYLLCVLSRFSKYTDNILSQLATSLSSDQAHVRSRSLKSISVILEKDASVLDRIPAITQFVFKLNTDDSANVRDSALSIIARFIIHRSAYSKVAFDQLQKSIDDEKPSIRKRVISHFKEIYQQVMNQRNRDAIMLKLLQRITDDEESVSLLAEQRPRSARHRGRKVRRGRRRNDSEPVPCYKKYATY